MATLLAWQVCVTAYEGTVYLYLVIVIQAAATNKRRTCTEGKQVG